METGGWKGGNDSVAVPVNNEEASLTKCVIEVIVIGWESAVVVVVAGGPDFGIGGGAEAVSGIMGGQESEGSTKMAFRKNCTFKQDKGKYFSRFGLT